MKYMMKREEIKRAENIYITGTQPITTRGYQYFFYSKRFQVVYRSSRYGQLSFFPRSCIWRPTAVDSGILFSIKVLKIKFKKGLAQPLFIIQRQDRSANEEHILCQGEKFILYLEYESVLNFIIDFICISRLRPILAINISPDKKNTQTEFGHMLYYLD